jgi:hypothetical protein
VRAVILSVILAVLGCAGAASAQDAPPAWTVKTDANAFFGYNYQQRKFADFWAWESQNWFMLSADRDLGSGKLSLVGMASLEPFTLEKIGSPQLFQTGESYQQIPLVNDQHPHDLVMALGATWRVDRGALAYSLGVDLVGSPALGPIPFMHRESARDNPEVPLTHHFMDSTHITTGVVTGGVERGPLTLEASAFRGEEPDENRLDIDQPRLNSYSARIGWAQGPWQAQFSGGHLHKPEWFEPFDVIRWTASVGFDGSVLSRPVTATLAWGENRTAVVSNGVADGFLLEWDVRAAAATSFYGRAEVTEKELFGLGLHPLGFQHPHFYSHVDALTLGVVRDLPLESRGRLGLGGDVTLYHMSADAAIYWAGSHSYHVFLRWRPTVATSHHHH